MLPQERNGMAKLTISEASRVAGIARSTLQRAVRAGRLSLNPDHTVDTAELLRAGFTLHAAQQPQDAAMLQDAAPRGRSAPPGAAGDTSQDAELLRREIALLEREREMLRAALDAAAAREQVALEREARLLHLLEQAQAQSQRLLEAPRHAPPAGPPATPPPAPAAPPGGSPAQVAPPALVPEAWHQIRTYMQAHPGPQRPQDVQRGLGWTETARHTMRHMTDAGVLRRVAPGVYEIVEELHHA
jgi:hypothetical protein